MRAGTVSELTIFDLKEGSGLRGADAVVTPSPSSELRVKANLRVEISETEIGCGKKLCVLCR